MAAAIQSWPQPAYPTFRIGWRWKQATHRLDTWHRATNTAGSRSEVQTHLLFRALRRELIRCSCEAGEQVEAEVLALLTPEEREEYGL